MLRWNALFCDIVCYVIVIAVSDLCLNNQADELHVAHRRLHVADTILQDNKGTQKAWGQRPRFIKDRSRSSQRIPANKNTILGHMTLDEADSLSVDLAMEGKELMFDESVRQTAEASLSLQVR